MAHRRIHVLLLTCDQAVVQLLETELGSLGYLSIAVDRLDGAEPCLRAKSFDIAFLDWRLRSFSGPPAIEQLRRELGFDGPVIALTGRDAAAGEKSPLDDGASDCLTVDELVAPILRRAIDYAIQRSAASPMMDTCAQLELLKGITSKSPILIVRFDSALRHIYVNRAVSLATGLAPDEILGRTNEELGMPTELCRYWNRHLRDAMREQSPKELEFEFEGPQGLQHYRSLVVPEHSQAGLCESVVCFTSQITQEKQMAQTLHMWNDFLEKGAYGFYFCCIDGRYLTRVNRAIAQMHGYEQSEMIGQPLDILYPRAEQQSLHAVFEELSRGGHRLFEAQHLRKDGTTFPAMVDVTVAASDVTGKLCWIACVIDISEYRQARDRIHVVEAELAHLSRLKTVGELAAGLSHELNQPLAAIMNYVDTCRVMTEESKIDPPLFIEALHEVAALVQRISTTVEHLRTLVRKTPSRRAVVQLNELVREVLRLLETDLRLHAIHVRMKLDESLSPLKVDSVQIQQVLLNLLSNAIDAMQDTPHAIRRLEIETAATSSGDQIITVADNGVGMDKGDLSKIFDPFYTTKPDGVGVGLSISDSIVKAHGGTIWVDQSPRRGLTVGMRLPADYQEATHAQETRESRHCLSGGR